MPHIAQKDLKAMRKSVPRCGSRSRWRIRGMTPSGSLPSRLASFNTAQSSFTDCATRL